jgi:tetratricopeptide (TPR) repeat protein
MEYLQSEKYEAEFYRYCDNAISKGEDLLEKEPNNVWVKFYIAGANGLKGTYESRYKRWLTAFKHGWRGIVIFRDILETNPEMIDALYGIATYDYWRSAKTKMLWWLPGVVDKRKPAIEALFRLQTTGTYVKESSSLNLIDMLLNEKRYTEALETANKILASYPSSLVTMWRKAEAQLGLGEFDKAEKLYKDILKRIEFGQFESNYNIALCHYYLSKIYFHLKRYKSCIDECKLMESFKLTSVPQKRLEDFIKDAASLKKKAQRKLSKKK